MRTSIEELYQWDRQCVWHAFTQMAEYEPLIVERAKGCTLIDVHGNKYLDGVSSLWCNVHGHRHPHLDQAIRSQLDRVAHVTSLGMSNPEPIRLAKRLVDLAPEGLNHVFFSSDGASAVETAIKMALQYWQQCQHPRPEKSKYVAFEKAYHGDTIGSISVGGPGRFRDAFDPLLFDVLRLPSPETFRLPDGVTRDTACEFYLRQLEHVLRDRHAEIAALVIEPLVQGAGGMVTQPVGYLRGVRELIRRYDVLLIADEVAVGMGRTGKMFACQHEEVTPDFLCLAKGLTGGYLPMSATLATDAVWRAFLGEYHESKLFCHGHTYGGNPLAAAVANATLDVFEQERTLDRLPEKTERLAEHLSRIAELPHVGDCRQRGMMAGIELVQDRTTKQPYPWQEKRGIRACEHARKLGVWLRPQVDVIVILPPLSVTLEELDRICQAAEAGIREVTK